MLGARRAGPLEQRHRTLHGGHPGGDVGDFEPAPVPPRQPSGHAVVRRDPAIGERPLQQLPVAGPVVGALGGKHAAEDDGGELHLGSFLLGQAVPQVPDAQPRRRRGRPGEHRLGLSGGRNRPVSLPGQVAGAREVHGHLRGRLGAPGGQHRAGRGVQPRPLRGEQHAAHGVLEQRVPQSVPTVLGGRDQPGIDELAQGRRHISGADAGCQLRFRERPPGDGERGGDLGGRSAHRPQAVAQQPADAGRDLVGRTRRRRRSCGGDQLLDEERAALAAAQDVVNERVRGSRSGEGGHESKGLLRWQGRQGHGLDGRQPRHVGEPVQQRVAHRELPEAAGDDHGDSGRHGAHQERQQVPGRQVGPVQVLDHQHGAALGTQGGEQIPHSVQEPAAVFGCRDWRRGRVDRERRKESRQLALQRRARSGSERGRGAAAPGRHRAAPARPRQARTGATPTTAARPPPEPARPGGRR